MNNQSDKIDELMKAIGNVQKEFKGVEEDGVNIYYDGAKYTKLPTVLAKTRDLLLENGLVITQPMATNTPNEIGVFTKVYHLPSDQWMTHYASIQIAPKMGSNAAQASGIITSYLRRYGFLASLGLYTGEDDDKDGNGLPSWDNVENERKKVCAENMVVLHQANHPDFKINIVDAFGITNSDDVFNMDGDTIARLEKVIKQMMTEVEN